ncbi:MAG: hypothetical protein JWP97_2 [Labilithrix sp.]|nr:hypothetical protein [Labilithrix sp.]
MKNRHVLAVLVLVAGVASSTRADAAPPTKEECVEAHSRGQDVREKGQLTDAKRLFLLCAQSSCPALVQSDCAKFGDELARTVPSVSFVARDGRGNDLLDTQVFVDGVLTMSRLDEGKSHDLDPGKHTVRFVHAGRDVTQVVVISAGERGRFLTAVFDDPSAPASSVAPGLVRNGPDAAAPPSRSAVPLVIAGIGGAALVVGAVLLVTGLSSVPDNCSRSTNECAASPGDPSFDDAKSAVNRANLGLGIGIGGAAVAVGGLVWYLASSPREAERTASSRVIPWTDGRGGGAAWHVRF